MISKSNILVIVLLINFACGRAPLSNRIVGGVDAPEGEWPWQVDIHRIGVSVCGGTVIMNDWVVSAAHCFAQSLRPSWYTVYLGRYQVNGLNQNEEVRTVKQLVLAPGFSSAMEGDDVALIQLSSPVQYTDHIQPICLPDSDVSFPADTFCYVTGWGHIQEGVLLSGIGTLQEVAVPIISQSSCIAMYTRLAPEDRVEIRPDMICAGYLEGGKDACQGDSGGPMMCAKNNTWVQAGLVSFGMGCARPNQPGVYARLSAFSSFIKKTVPNIQLFSSTSPSWAGGSWVLLKTLLVLAMLS